MQRAGSVFIVDMNGDTGSGALGDILIARLVARGLAGVVADGGMRDIEPVQQMSPPVVCRGHAAPPSCASLLAADVRQPIGCGGVLVLQADIVAADADGVVAIPCYRADALARASGKHDQMKAWVQRMIGRAGWRAISTLLTSGHWPSTAPGLPPPASG